MTTVTTVTGMSAVAARRASPPARTRRSRSAQRWLFGAGLLLPFVSFEPAPVDVYLVIVLVGFVVLGWVRVNQSHAVLAVGYMALSCIGLALGELTNVVPTGFATRSLAIDAYLVVAFVLLIATFRQVPGTTMALTRGYVAGAVVASGLILLVHYLHIGIFDIYRAPGDFRVRGTFKDPNVLGPYLVFPALLLLTTRRGSVLGRVPKLLVLPCLLTLWLTYSRGAYVAFAVGLALVLALRLRAISGRTGKAWLGAALLLLAVGLSAYLVSDPPGELSELAEGRLQQQSYDTDRFATLREAMTFTVEHPLGLGPGAFGEAFGTNPHNLFLGKSVDAGLVAGVLVVSVLLASARTALRTFRSHQDWVSAVLAATLAGHLVLSAVIYSHHWRHLVVLAALAWGRRADCRRRPSPAP